MKPDLLIVGGGPAGLATAIAARQEGLTATVLDSRRPPIDKACGEGLMPDAVANLAALGVRLDERSAARFRGIRYLDDETAAEGTFPGVVGYGIRRTTLHRALVARAEACGVELAWGTAVRSATPDGFETDRGTVTGRWLIGADGLHSRCRRWWGLERGPGRQRRFGVRRHFRLEPWCDLVEVYWARDAEAYVTPVAPDEVGVALLWSGGKATFDELPDRFPALAERLGDAPEASRHRGAGPFHQRVRRAVSGNRALVGDAAGYLDAITGEGLAVSLHQARAAVAAIRQNDLRAYQRAHRRVMRLPLTMTRLLLIVERHPRLRRRFLRTLAADPALFDRILAVHAREIPPSALGGTRVLRLARGLVSGT